MELKLECQKRPENIKPNALRRSGKIPAVLYGHSGTDSVELTVDAKAAELLLRDVSVNNSLIDLSVTDLPWNGKALLREVQSHPWKSKLYHLSFFSVGTHASLDLEVPIHTVGEAPGVKTGGGALDQVITSLRIRCAPNAIPEVIEVDISNLEVGGAIHVNELPLPEGVTPLVEKDQLVLSILGGSGGGSSSEEESA